MTTKTTASSRLIVMTVRRKNRLEYVLKNTIPLLIFLQIILIYPNKTAKLRSSS